MTTEWSEKDIEQSRLRRGVSPQWEWSLCEGGCGDIVWHPGWEAMKAQTQARIVLVCSAACSKTWMDRKKGL